MKSTIHTLLAAAAVTGIASAETAYTTPVGYSTQSLAANSFNLVGLNLQTPTSVAGLVGSVSGADITVTGAFAGLTAGKMHVLEITSGTAAGTVQEFTTWTNDTITLPAAIAGITAGDSFAVRIAPTLQNTFPIGAGLIAGSALATTADKIWVPTGPGIYTRYWYKTTSPVGWRTTSTGSNDTGAVSADVPLVYIDGILVEKKASVGSLVLTGEVKKTGSNVLLGQNFNIVSIVPPTGLTLFTAGLSGDIAGSALPSTADVVWVPAGGGAYTKYWYKTTSPAGWYLTTTGSNNAGAVSEDVTLPPAVFIQRKSSTPKVISMDVPASYSDL